MDGGQFVPIESQCRENYLYEIKDKNGEIKAPNHIEKILSVVEGYYATNLRLLESKAYIKTNYRTKCFLSTDEKAFWRLYVAVQMLRVPSIIAATKKVTTAFLNNLLDENEIHNVAITQCLPFLEELKPDAKNVFTLILRPLLNMSIVIGVDEKDSIFTSDNPVYCYYPGTMDISQIKEYERVVLPLTPQLVLFLLGGTEKEGRGHNCLFPLDDEELNAVKLATAYSANERVYSYKRIPDNDLALIQCARKDKKEDEVFRKGLFL